MLTVLSPVIDKDIFAELLEPELESYFYDTIFGPLFWALRDAGVELSDENQGIRFDEYGKEKLDQEERENSGDWTLFPEELHSLQVPREEMPQISGPVRAALIRHLERRGVGHEDESILPTDVRPTQSGYWPRKVETARAKLGSSDRPILISRDYYVLDGHHQWFAAYLTDQKRKLRAIRFMAGIKHLLPMAISLPSSERAGSERTNGSTSAIKAALSSGRLWYADGAFGSAEGFGSGLSRELRGIGARLDAKRGVFVISPTSIPMDLKSAIDTAQATAQAVHKGMIGTLEAAAQNLAIAPVGLKLAAPIERILRDLDAQFGKSVKGIEAVTVSPVLQPAVRQALTKGLTENLSLYIRNFAEEKIPELRKMVEANLMSGSRLDRLSEMIEAQYGVSKRKATFLATQETSLLTAKFRMERAKNVGSTRYVWHTRNDQRVRDDHAELDGTTQFWDQPPVVNKAKGKHANPGEDYGCRCWASPVIELPKKEQAA